MPDLSTFGRQIPSDPPFFVYSLSLSSQQMSDFDVRTSFVRLTLDMYTSDWSSPSISSSSSPSSPLTPYSPSSLLMIMITIVFIVVIIISITFMVSRLTSFTLSGHRLSVWPSFVPYLLDFLYLYFFCHWSVSSHLSNCSLFSFLVVICLSGLFTFFTGFTHV